VLGGYQLNDIKSSANHSTPNWTAESPNSKMVSGLTQNMLLPTTHDVVDDLIDSDNYSHTRKTSQAPCVSDDSNALPFVGFQSASSGEPIKIFEASLDNASRVLTDDHMSDNRTKMSCIVAPKAISFSTSLTRREELATDSHQSISLPMEDERGDSLIDKDNHSHSIKTPLSIKTPISLNFSNALPFVGFQSAHSGELIKISELSLVNASRVLYETEESDCQTGKDCIVFTPIGTSDLNRKSYLNLANDSLYGISLLKARTVDDDRIHLQTSGIVPSMKDDSTFHAKYYEGSKLDVNEVEVRKFMTEKNIHSPRGEDYYAEFHPPLVSELHTADHSIFRLSWVTDPLECTRYGVNSTTLTISSESASNVLFDLESGMPTSIGSSHVVRSQLQRIRWMLSEDGCDPTKISDKWIISHSRWIIWKLASIERRLAKHVGGNFLSIKRLVTKLRGRYIKEIEGGARSSIRQILNRDASSTRMIILCVASIKFTDIPRNKNGTELQERNCTLELTDGWYSLKAIPDSRICQFIKNGRIREGNKLCISNARLFGSEDGIDPLDKLYDTSNVNCPYLQIAANSSRLARWNAKLGFVIPRPQHSMNTGMILIRSLSDIFEDGGRIPLIHLQIRKRKPIMYLERTHHGDQQDRRGRILTEKEETARIEQFEKKRQQIIEQYTDDVHADCLEVRCTVKKPLQHD
jgi:BRCA2, oligonucleotide/oligosaccharide-binding, domain 1/BRCA2, helical